MTIRKNSNSYNFGYRNTASTQVDDDKSKIILLENQKLLKTENEIYDEEDKNYECENPDILDFDYQHSPPNAVIIPEFNYELKPHQIHALHFLYKACIGTLEKFRQGDRGSGAILAHCMGLGKTFESIAFISTIFSHNELSQKLSKILIIVPPKLIQKWQNEFDKFCQNPKINVQTLIADRDKVKAKRIEIVKKWFNSKTPNVLIIGNVLFRSADKDLNIYLQNPDIVFYDEAHQGLKNATTVTHQAFDAITTKRRILLTGTPSPNDLIDYYNLIYLANPSVLGTREQFDQEFKNPITKGSYKKATVHDIEYMERCCGELKERVKNTVDFQSQEYDKHDFVLAVTLTKPQIILYGDYLNRKNPDTGNKAKRYCLADFHVFNHLFTHPWLLIKDPEKSDDVKEWWSSSNIVSDNDKLKIEMSHKIEILIEIIKYCENVGDKLLIFSHSKIALNFIENVLTHLGKNKKWFVNGHNPNKIPKEWGWESQKDYFKLNGDVSSAERETFRKRFAEEERARVMLITKQSDGQGVDIPAANRVILFDIYWNPAVDEQAIFRVCRDGQKKTVYVYRFVAEGTMEECVYKRQILKSSTSKRVLTKSKIENWFTQEELKELYAFYATKKTLQNPELYEDKSLQQIIKNHPHALASIHSQDGLLRDTKMWKKEFK